MPKMATAELEKITNINESDGPWTDAKGYKPNPNVFHCHVALIREDDNSISAIVLNLPGAASCGQTEDEAISNVKESVCGLIASYKESGHPVPWKDPASLDAPGDARTRWILVNV